MNRQPTNSGDGPAPADGAMAEAIELAQGHRIDDLAALLHFIETALSFTDTPATRWPMLLIVDESMRLVSADGHLQSLMKSALVRPASDGGFDWVGPQPALLSSDRAVVRAGSSSGLSTECVLLPLGNSGSPPGSLFLLAVRSPRNDADADQRLQKQFALSPSESQLLVALHAQQSLQRAAESVGISIGNARTKLKRIMQKVGVNNQKSLILLVERSR